MEGADNRPATASEEGAPTHHVATTAESCSSNALQPELVETLVEDRLGYIRPELQAHFEASLVDGRNTHGGKAVATPITQFVGNVALYAAFHYMVPLAALGISELKRMQRGRSAPPRNGSANDKCGPNSGCANLAPCVEVRIDWHKLLLCFNWFGRPTSILNIDDADYCWRDDDDSTL